MKGDKMGSKKRICGIIGNPLSHSLSPIMHNAAFSHLKLDLEYHLFEINENEISQTIYDLKLKSFRGLNITHPYKKVIMEYVDVLSESAKETHSVNTILNEAGKLFGYNTDSEGVVSALRNGNMDIEKGLNNVLIFGAGGAARSAAFPLSKMGNNVMIVNRTFRRAEDLAQSLSNSGNSTPIRMDELPGLKGKIDIIINATPFGMKGGPSGSFVPRDLLGPDITVFDMVYNPMRTPLTLAAEERGAKVIYGFQMFIAQGAAAFELWTNERAPLELMRKTVLRNLEKEGDHLGR